MQADGNKMNKISWIEILKGIGITAVVAGHVYDGEIHRNIYIFHMPLFFFISGYLLTPTTDYRLYFVRKLRTLLLPYTAFLLTLYFIFNELPPLTTADLLPFLLKPLIGGRYLGGAFGVFWFVTCLFLTQQLMNFLISVCQQKTLLILMLVSLVLSYLNGWFSTIWLPWNANVVLMAAPVFYIGYCFKQTPPKLNVWLTMLAGILVLALSVLYTENVMDMKNANYGYPLITLISALVLTVNLKNLSEALVKIKWLEYFFLELGKASMVIMYLHLPILIFLKMYSTLNNAVLFVLTLFFAYLLFYVLTLFKVSRAFYLGSKNDFSFLKRGKGQKK